MDNCVVRSDCLPLGGCFSNEDFTMKSIIVISLSIALVTPALAAKRNHVRSVSYSAQASMGAMGPITSENYQQYQKALRESGYNPKNDYQSNGAIRDHLP
jgi:hypothetical protein